MNKNTLIFRLTEPVWFNVKRVLTFTNLLIFNIQDIAEISLTRYYVTTIPKSE